MAQVLFVMAFFPILIFKHIHWPSQFSQFSTCFQTLRFNFPAVSLLLLNNRNESKLQFCCNSAARSSDSNAHSEMLTILFANTAKSLSSVNFHGIFQKFKMKIQILSCWSRPYKFQGKYFKSLYICGHNTQGHPYAWPKAASFWFMLKVFSNIWLE